MAETGTGAPKRTVGIISRGGTHCVALRAGPKVATQDQSPVANRARSAVGESGTYCGGRLEHQRRRRGGG